MVVSQSGGTYTAKDLPAGPVHHSRNRQHVPKCRIGSGKRCAERHREDGCRADGFSRTDADSFVAGRVPETEVAKVSTDAKDLLPATARRLSREVHGLSRRAAHLEQAFSRRGLEFTIKRMRINMAAASLPDITDADAAAILKYTSPHSNRCRAATTSMAVCRTCSRAARA